MPFGIPSQDTFLRVFAMLDQEAFRVCFLSWVAQLKAVAAKKKHIALTILTSVCLLSAGKTIWLGLATIATAVLSAVAGGAGWQEAVIAAIGAANIYVRTQTDKPITK